MRFTARSHHARSDIDAEAVDFPRPRAALKTFAKLVCLSLALALPACGDQSSAERLEDYVAELEEVLGAGDSTQSGRPIELSVYPDRRDVRLPVEDLMISVFDFFDISRHCGLGSLVGERNSSLGLVMPDSQRFVYEQALLAGLRDCRDRLSDPESDDPATAELAASLELIVERKARELPRVFWNATFASEEFESLFSLSGGGPLAESELGQTGQRTLEALAYLQATYSAYDHRDRAVDSAGLEANLNNIRKESYGGRVLQSLRDLEAAARKAADLLDAGFDPVQRCARQERLIALYDTQIDGWLNEHAAAVEEHGRVFLKSVDALARLPQEPAGRGPLVDQSLPFVEYRRRYLDLLEPDGLWLSLMGALQRHEQQWQRALAPC